MQGAQGSQRQPWGGDVPVPPTQVAEAATVQRRDKGRPRQKSQRRRAANAKEQGFKVPTVTVPRAVVHRNTFVPVASPTSPTSEGEARGSFFSSLPSPTLRRMPPKQVVDTPSLASSVGDEPGAEADMDTDTDTDTRARVEAPAKADSSRAAPKTYQHQQLESQLIAAMTSEDPSQSEIVPSLSMRWLVDGPSPSQPPTEGPSQEEMNVRGLRHRASLPTIKWTEPTRRKPIAYEPHSGHFQRQQREKARAPIRRVQSDRDFHHSAHGTGRTPQRRRSLGVSPRTPLQERAELSILSDKLREMQLEFSKLQQRIHEQDREQSRWWVRYSRRLVITSNVLIGTFVFLWRFLANVRRRETELHGPLGWLLRLLQRHGVMRAPDARKLSAVVVSGLVRGMQSSLLFYVSAVLCSRRETWKRDVGFALSTVYSIYLSAVSEEPAIGNHVNILTNVVYLVARYWYLHGLLSFEGLYIR